MEFQIREIASFGIKYEIAKIKTKRKERKEIKI